MNDNEKLAYAIRHCNALNNSIAEAAMSSDVQKSKFDKTYIDFLDSQIKLCPRGEEWNARLIERRNKLIEYIDIDLIDAHVRCGNDDYWIKVDPKTNKVVYIEVYNDIFD